MNLILLVDDDPELRELYTEVLELMGHHVLRACDGQEALKLAHEQRPDLVVTDWMMPRMNGTELCRKLRQDPELHDIPIIIQSGSLDVRSSRAEACIPKGLALREFIRVVMQVLGDPHSSARQACTASQGCTVEP